MSLKIVFDFDGTLADTHHMVISAVNQIVNRETGREYTRKEIEQVYRQFRGSLPAIWN